MLCKPVLKFVLRYRHVFNIKYEFHNLGFSTGTSQSDNDVLFCAVLMCCADWINVFQELGKVTSLFDMKSLKYCHHQHHIIYYHFWIECQCTCFVKFSCGLAQYHNL